MTQTCRPGLALLQALRKVMCMGCVSEILRKAGNHCCGPALRRAGLRGKDEGGSTSPSRPLQPREENMVIESGPRWETGKQVNPLATMIQFIRALLGI